MKNIFKRRIVTSMIVTTSLIIATSSFGAKLEPFTGANSKIGFKNSSGKEVVEAKYDGVNKFVNGYIPVKSNNLWGFMDDNGKVVVPIIYKGVASFKDGYAPAIKDSKWGMVNTLGEEAISFKYDELFYFDGEGNANAKKDGKWGKIDKTENIVVPFMYDAADRTTKYTQNISKIILDGVEVEFSAYQIHDNNYIKIRDIAKAIDGSEKQFEVSWNKDKAMIDLISGESYTAIGGELEKNNKKAKNLRFNQSLIAKDGQNIVLKGYNIDNSNYFKLRDIAKEFNIGLTWNQETKTIEIDTTENYIE